MPKIFIRVGKWHDWAVTEDVTEEEVAAGLVRQNVSGDYTKKVIVESESVTEIGLPESEVEDCMEHFDRVDKPKSREQVVAWYVEEQVMPYHARMEDWLDIAVPEEPELEAYLKRRFDLPKVDGGGF